MYFHKQESSMEDTLEKAGGEETMSDKLKVNMNEYLPLRDVVFNTLRQAIITGEFAPGERLMEIALANRLGVSRTPVREAIRKLELEGLVVMIPRKGAEVARITEKDLRDVLEVRCSLEELAAEAVLSDYFLMSSNAITLDGELINIDGTGNRVACLSYGPKHVIMIVGMNKVVNDVEDGIKRVRNFASPPNTLRLGLKTPCSMTGRCGDCYGDSCICSQIVVTRRQSAMMKDRVKVILVGESLGY